jgi:hypothetical protein
MIPGWTFKELNLERFAYICKETALSRVQKPESEHLCRYFKAENNGRTGLRAQYYDRYIYNYNTAVFFAMGALFVVLDPKGSIVLYSSFCFSPCLV